ncbi:MAG: cold-shock protein [Planctomycetota bacterium]|jgi:CspA family cold shock protein
MAEGKVKWYDKKKGYGFILSDDNDDVFVHYTNFSNLSLRSLNDGEEVTFDIVPGEKGLRAQNVLLKSEKKTVVTANT